ncbi:hypothetical protein [Marivirga harenae]|uniref:DUF7010 family protein n=1 Tax=Marivirga harenae TaxID=2010992 RepID=UPI0026DF5A75|nr:hypothetical protein [Marivirga harenae]WKV12264.1 hypothetical protein Q3Y49_00230 [Marivirga harenae]|tara:strand:+ start:43567 stop:44109 length:543 start_codon:yes stop_codon:yes gene_type:complete
MDISVAQSDMRNAYFGGAPGVMISGLIWLISGIASFSISLMTTVIVFFIGGMLIHPLSIVMSKAMKRTGAHQKANPLANLALESTFLLFIGLFIGYIMLQIKAELFFPVMLLVIGGRYLFFSTLYGIKLFWLLGVLLILLGGFGAALNLSIQICLIGGGIIEVIFAGLLFQKERLAIKAS